MRTRVRRHLRHPRRRPAIASVLAMIFLMLFAILAIGFFAAVMTSTQVARNERDVTDALRAAESGMAFVRQQLARVSVPPATTGATVTDALFADLRDQLEHTANLGSRTLTKVGNDTINIPPIDLGTGSSFSATIRWAEPTLTLNVVGTAGGVATEPATRTVSVNYTRAARTDDVATAKGVFDYGIASKGVVQVKASVSTSVLGTPAGAGSILSASTASTTVSTGNGTVSGNIAVMTAASQVSLGGGSVGGETVAARILTDHVSVVPPPSFPDVDTAVFKPFATNVYPAQSGGVYKNIRVPPNTNPKFKAGDVIEGILYIESPNDVTFRGHATVNGLIVFEKKNNATVNSLDFRGNVSPSAIPNTAPYAALRAAANGLTIVAPTASVTMSGSTDGFLDGSVIAESISLAGSADLSFTKGSIIALGSAPTKIEGKIVRFTGTGSENLPSTGVTVTQPTPDSRFLPDMRTYLEDAQ